MNRFYIDDTGTPSFSSKSKYDPGDWNTWVAYFVPDFQREKLNHMISELFEAYRE
jgi:alpha-galactosidase